jgi:hypothetical protein
MRKEKGLPPIATPGRCLYDVAKGWRRGGSGDGTGEKAKMQERRKREERKRTLVPVVPTPLNDLARVRL